MGSYFIRHGERDLPEPPKRIYARIDRIEPDLAGGEEPVTVVFDGVDANSFDSTRKQFQIEYARLSILEVDFFDRNFVNQKYGKIELAENNIWFQLEITSSWTPIRLRQYTNLFVAPINRFLGYVKSVDDPNLLRDLNNAVSIEDVPDASSDEIRNELKLTESIIGAGVYDVGQGACQAFLRKDGIPITYFDFGGGVLANAKTFPTALNGLCTTVKPAMILSHLDWDHWSSAQRFRNALEMRWILPRQQMGFTHKAFLADVLSNRGRLLFWPNNLPSVSIGQITIEKCTGTGRNHSGLAVVLESPDAKEKILFTGDARYNVIPSALNQNIEFDALIVPHHGGDTRNNSVPRRVSGNSGRAVFSYGAGNSYGHPAPITCARHRGWRDLRTADRVLNNVGGAENPGHVGLFWGGMPRILPSPCGGGMCNMQIAQH